MRTEKELFELMLSRQDLFKSGICKWAHSLYLNGLMSKEEELSIDYYLESNDEGLRFDYLYWWKLGDIKPRIEWIKQQIEKL